MITTTTLHVVMRVSGSTSTIIFLVELLNGLPKGQLQIKLRITKPSEVIFLVVPVRSASLEYNTISATKLIKNPGTRLGQTTIYIPFKVIDHFRSIFRSQ